MMKIIIRPINRRDLHGEGIGYEVAHSLLPAKRPGEDHVFYQVKATVTGKHLFFEERYAGKGVDHWVKLGNYQVTKIEDVKRDMIRRVRRKAESTLESLMPKLVDQSGEK